MSGHGEVLTLALADASILRRQDHAARLAKAVKFYRANSDLGFDACAKLFRVGLQSLKAEVKR